MFTAVVIPWSKCLLREHDVIDNISQNPEKVCYRVAEELYLELGWTGEEFQREKSETINKSRATEESSRAESPVM